MTRALLLFAALLLILIVVIWTMQRRLIYFPTGGTPRAPAEGVEDVALRTEDGLTLAGWFLRGPASPGVTVLVCNGNAGNRAHRLPFAQALTRIGASVLLFDYRGFGGNPGSPSHVGLSRDARAARAYLATRRDVDQSKIVYFGESLGAAVAAELAVMQTPAALILRSPFTSLVDVGRHHYRFLPVRWILRDRFSTIDAVNRVRVPTLVIGGSRDTIVPIDQSQRVFDAAAGPKNLIIVPGADHNDEALFFGEAMMRAIERQLQSLR